MARRRIQQVVDRRFKLQSVPLRRRSDDRHTD
jgi:hypothetical protein